MNQITRKELALALLCCALWGSAAPFIKLGYASFGIETIGDILTFAGIRFTAAGILVLVFAAVAARNKRAPLRLQKGDWKPIVVLACLQTAGQYWFYYVGLAHTSGITGAVFTGTGSFLTVLAAAFLFHYEKMDRSKWLGMAAGFAGLVVMNLQGDARLTFSLPGEGSILVSQVLAALSAGMLKHYGKDHDPVLLSGWQFVLGGAVLAAAGLANHGSIPDGNPAGWLVILWLSFVSAAAYTLWGILLKTCSMSALGMSQSTIPLFGTLFSAMILHEWKQALSANTWLSLALVMAGIWLVSRDAKQPERRPPA